MRRKIQVCSRSLTGWNRKTVGNIHNQIRKNESMLGDLLLSLSIDAELERISECKKQLEDLYLQEEIL